MGMYTEIYVNVDLKEDTPESVLGVLRKMVNRESMERDGLPSRWTYLFTNMSYYTPRTCCAHLTFDEISNGWSLLGKGDIKNYEKEIEAFFEWIRPYVDGKAGDFIGYQRYEEDKEPTTVYI